MTPPPRDGPRRPYWWFLPVMFALLLIPSGLANAGLIAALVGAGALSVARAAYARRNRAATDQGSRDAVALGVDAAGGQVLLSDHQLSAHGLILGASGAGKSTTLLRILSEQVRRGRPVVAIDMKGSPAFAHVLAEAARAAGRPFRLWTPDGTEQWNPLAHGNAAELKDKLIATERFTEPHYQRAAERYTQIVMQVLRESDPNRSPTLEQVVDLMDPRRMAALLRNLPGPRAERVQDYLAGLTSDQLSAVRGFGTRLAILTESHTGRFLSPAGERGIDVRAALTGNEVVLFSLNSSTYGRLAGQLGTLAIQDLVTAAGHRLTIPGGIDRSDAAGGKRLQAIVGIDEFSGLGFDNVLSLIARGRESGIGVLLATQEFADLDRAGPGLRDQVVGSTAIKIVHRQEVPASALAIAQMAGTQKVWEQTYQIGRGPLGAYDTSRGTRRQVDRFVVDPNEIKTLPAGRAIMIAKIPETTVRQVWITRPGEQLDGPGSAPQVGSRSAGPREAGDRAAEEVRAARPVEGDRRSGDERDRRGGHNRSDEHGREGRADARGSGREGRADARREGDGRAAELG